MIWDRERYIAHSNFEFTGREMFCELFGLLVGLEDEWKAQGASKEEIELLAFDWDFVLKTMDSSNCGAITNIEPKIIEDTKEYQIQIDYMGRKTKLCKNSATIPLPLEHPVKSFDDWLKIKSWYEFKEERVNKDELLQKKKLQDKGHLIISSIPGGFDEPRQLMGEEELCIACYEQPELIKDILNTIGDTCIKVLERTTDILKIDCLFVHEDMAGKSGPLFGPNQINQFVKPYYKKVWDYVSQTGCTIFSQDSDGNMNSVIDDLLDCGLTAMYPCEPGANMDIVEIRKKYGNKLTLKGGIDKYVLRGTKEDIRKELEYKMCDITKGGGTVFGIDHRIPNGVPIENYRYYVNLGREILGLEPISGKGFERMAF